MPWLIVIAVPGGVVALLVLAKAAKSAHLAASSSGGSLGSCCSNFWCGPGLCAASSPMRDGAVAVAAAAVYEFVLKRICCCILRRARHSPRALADPLIEPQPEPQPPAVVARPKRDVVLALYSIDHRRLVEEIASHLTLSGLVTDVVTAEDVGGSVHRREINDSEAQGPTAAALLDARVFVPVLTEESLVALGRLTAASPADDDGAELLVHLRLALEQRARLPWFQLLPLLVGEPGWWWTRLTTAVEPSYGPLSLAAAPPCADVEVTAVEARVQQLLHGHGGGAEGPESPAARTVRRVVEALQDVPRRASVEGRRDAAQRVAAAEIVRVCRNDMA